VTTDDGLPPPQEVVEGVLAAAGGDCVVLVEEGCEVEVRFANNRTTTNGARRDRRTTVVRFVEVEGGVAAGVARRGGAADPTALVAAAEQDARGSPPAEDAAPLVTARDHTSDTSDGGFDAPADRTDLGVLQGVLGRLSGAFARAARGDRVLAGFAEHRMATTYLGSSTGLRLRHAQPTGAFHLVARSGDGSRSSWVGAGSADFADVDVDALDDEVTRGLARTGRQVALEAGRYETILPPAAVADLMTALIEAAGGHEAEEGRTVFSAPGGGTRVGQSLSPLPFELRSDPSEPGLDCEPFLTAAASSADVSVFDNGLPLDRTTWVTEGRLARLRYHRAGAARSKVPPAPPIDNLVLELPGATGMVDDLVARTERGLLLTCLWYIREVDPATLLLTGLTRDGVYLVEDGAVVGAVNNFRFNESPVDLLARVSEAGASVRTLGREFGEWLNRARMPPLRIPDFNMSSVSPAS
jgi:predicted Zn-dependent protease